MPKTYAEINEKIKNGEAVVLTAEEVIDFVKENGLKKAAKEVDIVTTASFGAMCSSGAFLNTGHSNPKIKMQKAWLNGVSAYCGLAAVDLYIGATEVRENDALNKNYPGEFSYGGGHVIEDLVKGKDIHFKAVAYGTDCYPRKELETWISLEELNEAYLCNPRNCYQNYNVAVNLSDKTIYTYMGKLLPNLGNASFSSAGQLSPLLNDPFYKTIGIGTRILLCGAPGYVYWQGTQHNPSVKRSDNGVPKGGSGTIATIADLKQAKPEFIRGVSFTGYGTSLAVGIAVPIPILDEEILKHCAVSDSEIFAPVVDYSGDYPNCRSNTLAEVSYAELRSGKIEVDGKEVSCAAMGSYKKSREQAELLKQLVEKGKFFLQEPIQKLPLNAKFKSLNIRRSKDG